MSSSESLSGRLAKGGDFLLTDARNYVEVVGVIAAVLFCSARFSVLYKSLVCRW